MNRLNNKSSVLLAGLVAGTAAITTFGTGCLGDANNGGDTLTVVGDPDSGVPTSTTGDTGTSSTATVAPDAGMMQIDAGMMPDAGMIGCEFGSPSMNMQGQQCLELTCSEQTFNVCSGTNGMDGNSCSAMLDAASGCVDIVCEGSDPQQICQCSIGSPVVRADGRTCSMLTCPTGPPREICDGLDGMDGASCQTSIESASGCITLTCPSQQAQQLCPPMACIVSPTRTSSSGETCLDITCPPATPREFCVPPGVGCTTSQDGDCSVTSCDDGTASRVCPPTPPTMATCTSTQTVTIAGDMRRDCLVETCDFGARVETTELFCTTSPVVNDACPRGTIDCPCNPDGTCDFPTLTCEERFLGFDPMSGAINSRSLCVLPSGCTQGTLGCGCLPNGTCSFSNLVCEDRFNWGRYACELERGSPPDGGMSTPDAGMSVPDAGPCGGNCGPGTVCNAMTNQCDPIDGGMSTPDGGVANPDASAPDAMPPPADAGVTPDAGPCGGSCPMGQVCNTATDTCETPDSGVFPDASVPDSGPPDMGTPDGGFVMDASAPDATMPPDGGTVTDSGVPPGPQRTTFFWDDLDGQTPDGRVSEVQFYVQCSTSSTTATAYRPFAPSGTRQSLAMPPVEFYQDPLIASGFFCEANAIQYDGNGNPVPPEGPWMVGHVAGLFRAVGRVWARTPSGSIVVCTPHNRGPNLGGNWRCQF